MTDPPTDAAQPNLRKLTLWETIDWYASSIGTEHEKHERKVVDQAIDVILNAHPDEDAPEGPYEIGLVEGEIWSVHLEPKPKQWVKWRFEGTEGECIVVRDALNRRRHR